jgi:hypothetical protein
MGARSGAGLLVGSLALVLGGCAETTSDGIETSKMCLDLTIETFGEQTTATASLKVECGVGGTAIELVGEDRFECDGVKLKEKDGPFGSEYRAQVPTRPAGEKYRCRFERESEQVEISVTAAEPVTLSQPAEGARVSLDDGFDLVWNPTDQGKGKARYHLVGDCIGNVIGPRGDDDGRWTVDNFENWDGTGCALDLEFARGPCVSAPAAFAGGTACAATGVRRNLYAEPRP